MAFHVLTNDKKVLKEYDRQSTIYAKAIIEALYTTSDTFKQPVSNAVIEALALAQSHVICSLPKTLRPRMTDFAHSTLDMAISLESERE